MHDNVVKLVVAKPVPDETLPAVSYTDAVTGNALWFIAVHGSARGIKRLAATIVSCNTVNGSCQAFPGKPIKRGLNWVFGFEGLPAPPQTYFLTVTPIDEGLNAGTNAVTVRFYIAAPAVAAAPAAGFFQITQAIPVQDPYLNAPVCPTFPAYGQNTANGSPTRAAMKGSGGQVIQGAPVPAGGLAGPPLGTWMFNFVNLPEDDYTFYVDNDPILNDPFPSATATDSNQVGGVTVDAMNCGPAPMPGL